MGPQAQASTGETLRGMSRGARWSVLEENRARLAIFAFQWSASRASAEVASPFCAHSEHTCFPRDSSHPPG